MPAVRAPSPPSPAARRPARAAVGLALAAALLSCQRPAPAAPAPLRVGHAPSPLLAPLYAAGAGAGAGDGAAPWRLVPFQGASDVGYALLAGDVDAGLVETSRALHLLGAKGGEGLLVAGAVSFPYGATLVVRGDLRLRLADLAGRTVGASEAGCKLLHQLEVDARRLGVDFDRVKVTYLPFADMVPALEAKAIDAAVVKPAQALLAELAGHKVLYQSWEVKAGDDCCPELLAQVEQLLLVRAPAAGAARPLVAGLAAAADLPPASLRAAAAGALDLAAAALAAFPAPGFVPPGEELARGLGGRARLLDPVPASPP